MLQNLPHNASQCLLNGLHNFSNKISVIEKLWKITTSCIHKAN